MKSLKMLIGASLIFAPSLLAAKKDSTVTDVRVIDSEGSKACTFVGLVTGNKMLSGLNVQSNIDSATKAAMKKAAKVKANAIVVKNVQLIMNGNGATVIADAYLCATPELKPPTPEASPPVP